MAILGTSQSVLETKERYSVLTVESSVNTSALHHYNHQVETISSQCHGGGFVTQKILILFSVI